MLNYFNQEKNKIQIQKLKQKKDNRAYDKKVLKKRKSKLENA